MRTVAAFLIIIAVILISGLSVGALDKKTVAILYFENNSLAQKNDLAPLSKGLADMLITEMSKIGSVKVIERAQLQQLLEEMKLGMSGVVDEGTAQQVGKLLGAQTLLLGSFMNMFDNTMRIDVRIVEVETGVVLKAEEETGKKDKLFDMVKKLTRKVATNLNIKLTKEDEQKIKQSENDSFEAAMYYAKGLELQDQRKVSAAMTMYRKALSINPNFTSAKQRIKELQE